VTNFHTSGILDFSDYVLKKFQKLHWGELAN